MPWPQRLYGSSRWRKRSDFHLHNFPTCAACERQGIIIEATVSHHINEHRDGDNELLFWFGPLESLCANCHLKVHGRPAMRGYSKAIGADGYPIDTINHPFWKQDRKK